MNYRFKRDDLQMSLVNSNLDCIGNGIQELIKENQSFNYKFYEIQKKKLELAQKRLDFDKKSKDRVNISKEEYLNLLKDNEQLKKDSELLREVISCLEVKNIEQLQEFINGAVLTTAYDPITLCPLKTIRWIKKTK